MSGDFPLVQLGGGDERAREAYAADLQTVWSTLNRDPAPVHPFIAQGISLHSALSEAGIKSFLAESLRRSGQGPEQHIPRRTHRVWLTGRTEPRYPSTYFLSKSVESFERMPESWTHTIWVRFDQHRDHFLQYFREQGLSRVEVRPLDSLPSWALIGPRIDTLLDNRLFVAASDIARLAVLTDLGGLYCDLGIRLNFDVSHLLADCHYAFQWGNALFLQNSMMATRASDPLFRAMTLLAAQPERMNRRLLEPLTAESEMWVAGGPGISLVLYLMAQIELNLTIFTSNGELINHEAQQSWYRPSDVGAGHGSHGNALVTDLPPVTSPSRFQDGALLVDLVARPSA